MSLLFLVLIQIWAVAGLNLVDRNTTSGFVSVSGSSFQLDGKNFRFYGTNAYWLHMTTDDDIDFTFRSIAAAGLNVVRTWAFNDVLTEPASGPYFQILNRGRAVINNGTDGLQRLDKVVETADKYGLKLLLTLTNNWNPESTTPNELPRGYLSNDFGGMDLYVRNFRPGGTHDLFYTDRTIIGAFKNYLASVVPRYATHPAILGWELGNDLRCSSTLPSSFFCNTKTITKWVAEISNYVKQLDPHHLVTAGDGGFYCLQCSKLFAKKFTQLQLPPPGHSFDGSYGVDTEDILAVPGIDFGSFQFFPDETEYFPADGGEFATMVINDGGQWTRIHSNSATLEGKPEVLTAVGIVSKERFSEFAPFSSSTRVPDGTPCGGVDNFQEDYAFTSWGSAVVGGGVSGMLEYQWFQDGLTGFDTTDVLLAQEPKVDAAPPATGKKGLTGSPQDGKARYRGPATGQNAKQFTDGRPPI